MTQPPNVRRAEESAQQPAPVDEIRQVHEPVTSPAPEQPSGTQERPRPTTPAERVERARVERPQVDGDIDGRSVREAVIGLLGLKDSRGDRVLKALIEQQFSDDNLKQHFHRALDGGLIVDLGSRRRSAPQIRLEVTSLGTPPSSPTRTSGDFSSSHRRDQMKTSLSNTRSLVSTGERNLRIPFKIAALTFRVGGLFNARGSDLTLKTTTKGETRVERTDVPGEKALHDMQFTITARKPRTPSFLPLQPIKKTDNVSVPVTLLWPESSRSSDPTPATARLERPQDVVHADFAGIGDVYHAVENELGGFPPSSEGARRLRDWLHTLPATAPELLSGRPQRASFQLPGRRGRTEITVSVTEPKVTHPRGETEGTITRSREASAETSSGESVTRRRGGAVGIQFGTFNTKGANPAGGIGPTLGFFRSTKTETRVTQTVHDEFSAKYTGPVTKQDVQFEFVVRVGDGQHRVEPPRGERGDGRPAIVDEHDMSRPENFDGKKTKPVDPAKVRHYEPDIVLKVEGKAVVWSKPHDAADSTAPSTSHDPSTSTSHDPSTSTAPATVAEPTPATHRVEESPSMPPGVDASRVLDRVDADHRLPEETISHLTGAVLHRLEVDGLVRAGDLAEVEQRFRRFLEDHAHDLVRGGDGVRFPLEAWHGRAPDVFVRARPDLSTPRYAGVVESETGTGTLRAAQSDSVEVGRSTEVSGGVTASGTLSKKNEYFRTTTVGLGYEGTFSNTKEIKHELGHERGIGSDRPLHRVRFPAEFEIRFGGRWAEPGEPMHAEAAHRFHSEIEVVASERPVPLDEPVTTTGGDTTPDWHDGESPESQPQQRRAYLPPRIELDSLKPVPEMLGTVAKMIDAPPEASWLTLITSPLAGSRPARFDEHKGLGPLSRQEGELDERNVARDALESFTSSTSRAARFERAAGGADVVVLKSHNRPGMVANRERTARVELATELANPKILAVDDAHTFSAGDVSGTEVTQKKAASHGVKARVDFGNSFPVAPDKARPTVIANLSGGYLRSKESTHGDTVQSTATATRSERGYLVSFDATHKVHTKAQHTWHDIAGFGHQWPVPTREATRWVHVPDAATVWVPASEIHRVGQLLDGDLAKLDPADAGRYHRENAAAANAADTSADNAADTSADNAAESATAAEGSSGRDRDTPQDEQPERDDLRPPADVGRGTGRVEVYRPESGKELLTQIAAHLADWTKQPEALRPAGLADLARQLVGGPSRRQAEFEPINDRLVSDALGPRLVGADFNAALREMLGNGLPVFLPGRSPLGKIEQLVVLTAELGDGAYHRTVAGEKVDVELKTVDKSGTKTNRAWNVEGGLGFTVGRARQGQWGWGLSQGGALAHTRTSEIEFGQERGDSTKFSNEADSVEFLHDLKVKMEVYSHARSGAYRTLLPGARRLDEHFEGTFELRGAVRSTVPVDDAVPAAGRAPRPPLSQAEGSLRDLPEQEGRPGGLSDDAVIRPFDAPKLNDAIRELAGGGNGRPMMSPRAIHELQSATTSPMLRARLNDLLSPGGHEVRFPSGGVKSVKISVDVVKRELVEVLEKPVGLDVTEKRSVTFTRTPKTELKGSSSSSTNEPQLNGSVQRPSEMVHDVTLKRQWESPSTGESSTTKETKPAKTEDSSSTQDAPEHRRYLVRLTPTWEITPGYRSSRAPQAWSAPIRTEADRPVLVETNREGLRHLGLDDPAERPVTTPDSSPPASPDAQAARGDDPAWMHDGHQRGPLETIEEEGELHEGSDAADSVREQDIAAVGDGAAVGERAVVGDGATSAPAGLRTVSDGNGHRSQENESQPRADDGRGADAEPTPADSAQESTRPADETGQPSRRRASTLADFLLQERESESRSESSGSVESSGRAESSEPVEASGRAEPPSRPSHAERATHWVKERLGLRTATRENVELHGEGVADGARRVFHTADVKATRVSKDGRDAGLVFYTGRDKADVRSWLQRHEPSETTQLFPEGVRDGEGISQARAAGEFESVPAPWPRNSLHVFAHGGENRVRIALRDGTEVNVDGRTFGRLVKDLKAFHRALDRSQAEALVMVVCDPATLDGPSATAHDFHQALSESFQPPRVYVPTRDVYSRVTESTGRVEYSVADGGRWREFPARQSTEDATVAREPGSPDTAGSLDTAGSPDTAESPHTGGSPRTDEASRAAESRDTADSLDTAESPHMDRSPDTVGVPRTDQAPQQDGALRSSEGEQSPVAVGHDENLRSRQPVDTPSREPEAQRQQPEPRPELRPEGRPEARPQRPVDRLETIDEGDERAAPAESPVSSPAPSRSDGAVEDGRGVEEGIEEQAGRPQTSLAALMAETDGHAFHENADGITEHPATEPSGRQHTESPPGAERKPLRQIARQVRRLLGFDRSKIVQGVSLTGVDQATGRHVTFTSSDVQFRQMRGRDGATVGLSFSDGLQTEGDGHFSTLTHRQTTVLLPEGVTTAEGSARAAREGLARSTRTPWPENSFYIGTHGYPNAFGVDLKDGRWLHVSGDSFGHLLNDLRPFRESVGRTEALALLVCNVGAIDTPGGAAHDLQHALGQFGRRQPVVAATKPMGTTSDPGAGTWGTYVTDGGRWRVLSSGPAQVLGQDPQGNRRAFDADGVEATPLVRDGRTIGVSFSPDGADGARIAQDAPAPDRTLLIDADQTGDGRFVVHTPDGPLVVDGSTFGRIAANTQVLRDAIVNERPDALTLLAAGTEGAPRARVNPAADFADAVQREFGTTTPVFAPREAGGWTMHGQPGPMVSGVDETGTGLHEGGDWRTLPEPEGGASRRAEGEFFNEPRGGDGAGPSGSRETLGKRPREDESGGSSDEWSSSDDEHLAKRTRYEDVVLRGPSVPLSSLDAARVVHNAAFDGLAQGPVRLPGKAEYLDLIDAGVRENKPISFVVTAILGHGALRELPAVLDGMMRGARDVDGKVAFVFGVNAKAGGEAALARALAEAAPIVRARTEPVALVPLVWDGKSFPYGDMRNRTIDSPAGRWAVGAMVAKGTHPYLAAQDFDAGSRAVPSGEHVFTHVTDLLRMGGPDERVDAGRPLMISGGYRISDPQQLVHDTNARIDGALAKTGRALGEGGPAKEMEALRKERAVLEKARAKVNMPRFAEEFAQLIDEDMRARDRQVGAHELLPYTPEPNLFVDAVAVMADPAVRFGQGAAEYTNLGRTINTLYAEELTRIHGEKLRRPGEDAEAVVEQARVDAQTNRHPLRGQAFATDFVAGAIETDLSRLALGWAKDGKLPQSHLDLTTVVNRFFGGANPQADRAAKRDTSLAEYRKGFAKKQHVDREPQQVDAAWTVPASDVRQLGGQDHNTLNPAISVPLPGEFSGVSAGVQGEHKTIAAHHLATSDTSTAMARALGSIRHEVLPAAPSAVPGSLYRAVDPAHADRLRVRVLDAAANAAPKTAAGIEAFVRSHPIEHHGHLVNALIQHHRRVTDADPAENARAGNADDLAARLIATELKNDLVIHHPDGTTTTHEPFAGKAGRKPVHITHHVDADGRHTYTPGRLESSGAFRHSAGTAHMPVAQHVPAGPLGSVRADVPLSGFDTATGGPVGFRTSEVQINPLRDNDNRVVGATFWSGGEAVRDVGWVRSSRAQVWPANTFFVSGPGNARQVGVWLADGRMVSVDGSTMARMLNDVEFFRSAVDANRPPTFGLLMSEASAMDGPGALAADFQSTLANEFGYRQSAIGPSAPMDRAALDGFSAHDGGPWRELHVPPVVTDVVLEALDPQGARVAFRSSQIDVVPMEHRGSVIGAIFLDGPLRRHDLSWASREQTDYALLNRRADDPRGAGGPDAVPRPWPTNSFYISTHGSPQQTALVHLADGTPLHVDGATFARLLGDLVFFHHAMRRNQAEALTMIICYPSLVTGPGGLAHDFQSHLHWEFGYSQPVHAATDEVSTQLLEGGNAGTTVDHGGVWRRFPPEPVAARAADLVDPVPAAPVDALPDDPFDPAGLVDDLVGPEAPARVEEPVNLPELDDLFDRFDSLNLPDENDLFHSGHAVLDGGQQFRHSGAADVPVSGLGNVVAQAEPVRRTGGADLLAVPGNDDVARTLHATFHESAGRDGAASSRGDWSVPADRMLSAKRLGALISHRTDTVASVEIAGHDPTRGPVRFVSADVRVRPLVSDRRTVGVTFHVDAGRKHDLSTVKPPYRGITEYDSRPGDPGSAAGELIVDRPGSAGERTFLRALEDFAHNRAVHEAPQLAPAPRQQTGAGLVVRRTAQITELDEPGLSRSAQDTPEPGARTEPSTSDILRVRDTRRPAFDRSGTPTPVDVLLAGERPAVRRPSFDPADVVSAPLEHNGRTVGVSFQTGDSLARAERWAEGAGKDISELLDTGVHSVATAGSRRRRLSSPWSDNVFYVHGGGAPDHVELTLRDGSRVAADGTRLAVVLAESETFRRAVTHGGDLGQEIVLLASHTGARRSGLGHDFQRAMTDFFGFDRPVLAPTKDLELVHSRVAGYSGTGLRDGGLWRVYPDVGVVATGHTPDGQRIRFRRDALTTTELTRGDRVAGMSFRDEADPVARQWAEHSGAAGVETSWPRRSFIVDAPGDADHVRVLVDGRPVRLDGHQLAALVVTSEQWRRAATDRHIESVVLLVSGSGHGHGPDGLAHDFHRVLSGQFAYRGRVHAPIGATRGEDGWRAVPSDVVEGTVLKGVDAKTGRPTSFGSWEVRTTEMRHGGRVLGLAFTVAGDRQVDLQISGQTHTGETHRFPEGIVTWEQHLNDPAADVLSSPWPNTSFLISTHGQATEVELNLRNGRQLAVTGATFARVAHDLRAFRDALDMQGDAITMLVCYAAAVADSGGVARDFQRVLGDLGYEQPVVAGSRLLYLWPDRQAGEWETAMNDGGLWRSFSSGPAGVLVQDAQTGQWRLTSPDDVRIRSISDQGRPVAVTYRAHDATATQARLREIVKHTRRDPSARDAFFVDADLTEDDRFIVRTGDQRSVLVDAGTLARMVSTSIPFTQLMSGPDQPGRFELLVDRPGSAGERTFLRALEDFAHNRDAHEAPEVGPDLRRVLEQEAGMPVRPRHPAQPADPAAPGPSRLGAWLDEAGNRSAGELTGWTDSGEVRHFTADVIAPHDMEGRPVGMSFHSEDAPVLDDGLPALSSTGALLQTLVLQAIELEVTSIFGREGHVVVAALTGRPGQGDAAEELERAVARWLGSHTLEPGWRRFSAPGGVPAEPAVLVVPGVTGHDSVNDSPQADDTPPARAKSLREFLDSERGR